MLVTIKNKLEIIIIVFLGLFMTSCKNQIIFDYPALDNQQVIIRYVDIDEIFNALNNSSAIIMMGFKECPWCQYAIEYVNKVAIEKGYQEVFYLDIKDLRDNEKNKQHEKYLELYTLIKSDIGNPEKIIAPTVIVVKDQKIIGYHTGTVTSHQLENGTLYPLNDEQILELELIYSQLFE